jgi:hypothetical protein
LVIVIVIVIIIFGVLQGPFDGGLNRGLLTTGIIPTTLLEIFIKEVVVYSKT